jgi:hypothetical protein
MSTPIAVAAVDPGITNAAAWIGTYDPDTGKVLTRHVILGAVPCPEPPPKKKKKPAVYETAADLGLWMAPKCRDLCTRAIVVETAPRWNSAARISAAATYGALRGAGLPNVRFSGPGTKARAMEHYSGLLKLELERAPAELDKSDKKDSAKVRLVNKRNAVRVAQRVLEHSGDGVGARAMAACKKKDDVADALLLACGIAMQTHDDDLKAGSRKRRRPPQATIDSFVSCKTLE